VVKIKLPQPIIEHGERRRKQKEARRGHGDRQIANLQLSA